MRGITIGMLTFALIVHQLSPFHRSTVFTGTVGVTVCLSLTANTPLLLVTMVATASGLTTSTTSISHSHTGARMANFWLVLSRIIKITRKIAGLNSGAVDIPHIIMLALATRLPM